MASSMSNHESFSVSLAGRLYRRFRALFSMSVRVHPWELMNKDYLLMSAFATTEWSDGFLVVRPETNDFPLHES